MPLSPLIGRVEELDAISSAWIGTNPATMTVLITGEAGSGKSRLVAEAIDRLRPVPDVVLAGASRTHGPAPYDWLASVLAGRDLADLPVPAPVLGWLTQRAEGWLAPLGKPAEDRQAPLAEDRPTSQDDGWLRPQSKGRLAPAAMLRAATDVVRALLHGRRGVLVVEDLHDLDPASLTLVAELAVESSGAGPSQPTLLLVTSRSLHEAAFPPVAARTLRRLAGAPNVVRAHLAPFTTRETADLIEACCGAVPAPETVRVVHARTGGNPFWLTELIAASTSADGPGALASGPLPPHLAALAVEALDGEPPLVGRVARAAALLCDPAERDQLHTDQLYAVCGDDVEAALRRLVDLGMLIIAPDGPLRFRTPLLREAVAVAALPRERATVHRRARAFAAELSDDDALARHADALGRREEAAAAAQRAIQRNQARPEATLAAVAVGLANTQDPNLFLGTGASAALATGRFAVAADYAARWLDRAAGLAERADAHRQVAVTRWHLGDIDAHRANLTAAAELTAQALAQRQDGALAGHARQLAAEAETLLRTIEPAAAIPIAEAALEAATGAREPRAEASATATLGAALAFAGEHERGVALLRAGRLLAEQCRDLITFARAINDLVAVCLPKLGLNAGWRLFDEAMEAIGRFGLQFSAGRTTSLGYQHALRAGDLARAESLVWGRLPIETDPLERARFTSAAGLLAVERGDDPLAVRMLGRVGAEVADLGQPLAALLAGTLAGAVASRGSHPAEATRCLAEHLQRLPTELAYARPLYLAEAVRWALRGGAPAAEVDQLVRAAAPEALAQHRAGAQLRLVLAAVAGDDEQVADLAQEALDGPTEVAWQDAEAHATLAQALVRLGRGGEAREHAERAATLLHRWPGWRRDEAETLLHSLRTGGDLTAREIEVLGCLAAGMSNQQVARSLGISIRTVTVHVSNLLRKTGAASRTEAALWAVRHRLARGR